jgi:hypothetical protein
MEDIRYLKQFLDYRPIERRIPGRPLKRPLDGYSREAETGHFFAELSDQKKEKKTVELCILLFIIKFVNDKHTSTPKHWLTKWTFSFNACR